VTEGLPSESLAPDAEGPTVQPKGVDLAMTRAAWGDVAAAGDQAGNLAMAAVLCRGGAHALEDKPVPSA
jgi:hypothetical protein